MIRKTPALLDQLLEKTGCDYLSDLHDDHFTEQVLAAVRIMDAEAFSISDWEDAIYYITGQKQVWNTPVAAKDYLSAYLKRKDN